MTDFQGKSVLITGACGTVGSALARLLLKDGRYAPGEVICIDNNESALFFLDQELLDDSRASCFLADIRDGEKLIRLMRGVDVVFHVAALKHVVLCERSPFEAVQTNIYGMQNVIIAAAACAVDCVILTSSDKAVNPTNVMGTSKLMSERIVTAANSNRRNGGPIFSATRFGNVLGSNGSVVPIFKRQIAKGGPVTLTDVGMSRFVMTVAESVQLVVDSASLARGGEVFITKMPVVRIADLAFVMIEELAPIFGYDPADIRIEITGVKPGEKLYEELMSGEETRRAVELERYFAVLPAFRGLYGRIEYDYSGLVSRTVDNPYISSDEVPMDRDALRIFLKDNDLLSMDVEDQKHPDQRYWPGDKKGG